ncbi:MAG: septum formation family protein [Nocardioides sp.]
MLSRLTLVVLLVALTSCTVVGGDAEEAADTQPPEVGQCRMLSPQDIQQPSNDGAPVRCNRTHTAETFAVGTFPDAVSGDGIDDPALGAHVFGECEKEFRRFLGGDESAVMRATVTWAWFRPSEAAWDAGARWWRCDVVGGGEESTSLVTLPETAEGLLLGQPDDRWQVCVDGPSVADSVKIPCTEPHTWRAVSTIVLGEDEDDYPGDRVVASRTRSFCSDSVGAILNYPVDYDYGYTFFHQVEWEAGNRRSICWAKTQQ